MTAEEYSSMETQAMVALQRFREYGIHGDDIGILMSREVYDMAKFGNNPAYAVVAEKNFRAVYWGYDIYVINENAPQIFSPILMRFPDDCDLHQFGAGTFLIPESDDGTLQIYEKSTRESSFFFETEFTAHKAYQTGRVKFADLLIDWDDWNQYFSQQPDFFTRPVTQGISAHVFERQLNEVAAMMQRKTEGKAPKRRKAPPKKDWDERITPKDTKELDEFLDSLARKGTLESAT